MARAAGGRAHTDTVAAAGAAGPSGSRKEEGGGGRAHVWDGGGGGGGGGAGDIAGVVDGLRLGRPLGSDGEPALAEPGSDSALS